MASQIQPGLPKPLVEHSLTLSDGAELVIRQHGRASAPRLVLSHGNGLAIDGYAAFWLPLCQTHEVIVFDMRNHGRNPLHGLAQHRFDRLALDIGEVFECINEVFGARPCAGIFHSMSAIAATTRLATAGPYCDALVLVDPPVYPPSGHRLEQGELAEMKALAERASRRPADYASPDELATSFANGRAFKRWVTRAAQDMAMATLRLHESTQRWHLSCPREYEAKIYVTNSEPIAWQALTSDLSLPVLLLGGDPQLENQMQPALLSEAISQEGPIEYRSVPQTTHFLQIEEPLACIEEIEQFFKREVSQCSGR